MHQSVRHPPTAWPARPRRVARGGRAPASGFRAARSLSSALALAAALPLASAAQDPPVLRGFTLEGEGRFAEAATAFRAGIGGEETSAALLGLERSYAAMGRTDSILPILDSLIAADRGETLYRTVQLRSLQLLRRDAALRAAFEQWVADSPRDPLPYREYARLLLSAGSVPRADTVLRRAQQATGRTRELAWEVAQLRAAMGMWIASAQAWREALRTMPYLSQAALFSLLPAPDESRDHLRGVLAAAPTEVGARVLLSELELNWGQPRDGWAALRVLPPGDSVVAVWERFAARAEERGAPLVARDALLAAHRWNRSPTTALRAASAALQGGDAASALQLAEEAGRRLDRSDAIAAALPVRVRALSALGRPADAERLVSASAENLTPVQRGQLEREVAWAWVRAGDLARARLRLASAGGAEGVGVEAAGWIALYEGDLRTAREQLRRVADASAETIVALSVVTRTTVERSTAVGQAFLALARGDSSRAAMSLAEAAREVPEAAPALLGLAARIHAARGADAQAADAWRSIIDRHADAPEAVEATLELARSLRRGGDLAAAIERLEHLILTYPRSALVPQARRELELARGAIPGRP